MLLKKTLMLERLKAGEGDDRGWDGWMASPTQWTWVWVDSGRWWWTGRSGVLRFMGSQSRTRLSDFTFTFHFHALEKEMAAHSSVLAWRTPGMGEPGGLPSMGLHRVGHDWSDLAAAAAAWINVAKFFNNIKWGKIKLSRIYFRSTTKILISNSIGTI